MKASLQSTPYFSAYPLKAIKSGSKDANHTDVPNTKIVGRLRVMPMINPYTEKQFLAATSKAQLPAEMKSFDNEWFNNYE